MENSNDIKSIDIEERLNPSLTNATVNIVTYTFRMKYGKKYFEKFSNRRRLAGRRRKTVRFVGGKGENHLYPHRKGVRRWKLSPATMANSAGLMLSAKPYCEMRPETTTGI